MTDNAASREAREIADHPCWWSAGQKLSHRHWFQNDALMPTCERCGTQIDREHKEVGPVSWEPEKRREIVTLQDRYAISEAAMTALGEWLAWPDAGRDGPREVTVQQTLSFLQGLPNKLGYGRSTALADEAASQPREGVEALCERVYRAGLNDGWRCNQQGKKSAPVAFDEEWHFYVKNGALAKSIAATLHDTAPTDQAHRGEYRTHGPDSAIDDEVAS